MKFNFKKIASVLAGTVLLGSTLGFAGALADSTVTYPTSFANSVVVVGSASTADTAPANDIAVDLGKLSGTSTVSGESVKIETGSTKLHIGDALNSVRSTIIGSSDLPTLLAAGTYQSTSGSSYDYTQEIKLASGLTYGAFADIDYNNKIPSVGIDKGANSAIMNYTLRFTKTLESSVDTNGRLADIEDSDITLLGKTYRILNAYNSTNLKLELMGGAVVDTLDESSKKTYTIEGKSYDVSVSNIASDGAALTVNGQTTPKMTAGSTYKLSDDTQVGIRTIWYQANKVSSVEFSLGAQKLTLQNGSKLKLNDDNVNDVTVYTNDYMSGADREINSITLAWVSNDKLFITPDQDALFPGLGNLKITMTGLTVPNPEVIDVNEAGDNVIQLKMPIKSGEATFPILAGNGTKFIYVGADSTGSTLRTSAQTTFTFNRTSDQYFVATWNSSTQGESYLLKVTNTLRDDPSTGQNSTTIDDAITGNDVCKEKKAGDTCTIGNVVLTVNTVDPNGMINISGGSGVNFNEIYTPNGFKVWLPVDNSTTGNPKSESGGTNCGVAYGCTGINATTALTSFRLWFAESDKTGKLAAGNAFNVSLGFASSKVEVSSIDSSGDSSGIFSGSYKFDLGGTSTISKYIAYLTGSLGTNLVYDTKPDQNTLEITYGGGESYGNVYIASASAIASSVLVVKDTDISQYSTTKDLVVVGGSAINSVAATLLKVPFPTYGTDAAWTAATGVGPNQALIKVFSGSDSLTPGKVAILVAGYEAKDTQAAAKALIAEQKTGLLSTTTASTYAYQLKGG